jgi:hypothetical protein
LFLFALSLISVQCGIIPLSQIKSQIIFKGDIGQLLEEYKNTVIIRMEVTVNIYTGHYMIYLKPDWPVSLPPFVLVHFMPDLTEDNSRKNQGELIIEPVTWGKYNNRKITERVFYKENHQPYPVNAPRLGRFIGISIAIYKAKFQTYNLWINSCMDFVEAVFKKTTGLIRENRFRQFFELVWSREKDPIFLIPPMAFHYVVRDFGYPPSNINVRARNEVYQNFGQVREFLQQREHSPLTPAENHQALELFNTHFNYFNVDPSSELQVERAEIVKEYEKVFAKMHETDYIKSFIKYRRRKLFK